MKHLGACLQRLPREPRFYRQQASSAGRGGGCCPRRPLLSRPSARPLHTCPSGPELPVRSEAPGPAGRVSPGVGVAGPSGLLSSHTPAFHAGS